MPHHPDTRRSVRLVSWLLRPLLWLIAFVVFGCRIKVVGRENVPLTGPVLILPNHVTNADPPLNWLVCPRQVNFVAKAELFKYRLIGNLLRWHGHIPVDRSNAAISGAIMMRTVETKLQAGQAVGGFPEGALSRNPAKLRELKTGFARLAVSTGVPVVPVGSSGLHQLLPHTSRWPKWGKTVVFSFGPVMYATQVAKPESSSNAVGGAYSRAVVSFNQRLAEALQAQVDRAIAINPQTRHLLPAAPVVVPTPLGDPSCL